MERVLMPLAVISGVVLLALGVATLVMIFQYGASDALRIMGRNLPWAPYLAPFGVLLLAWMVVDGLTSKDPL